MRVRKYLAERARMGGIDFERINGLHEGHEREAYLLSSDLVLILNHCGIPVLDAAAPYKVGENCSWLEGNEWHVCTVTAIDPLDDGLYRLYADLNTSPGRGIAKTVDAKGVGEGVAPLRER